MASWYRGCSVVVSMLMFCHGVLSRAICVVGTSSSSSIQPPERNCLTREKKVIKAHLKVYRICEFEIIVAIHEAGPYQVNFSCLHWEVEAIFDRSVRSGEISESLELSGGHRGLNRASHSGEDVRLIGNPRYSSIVIHIPRARRATIEANKPCAEPKS